MEKEKWTNQAGPSRTPKKKASPTWVNQKVKWTWREKVKDPHPNPSQNPIPSSTNSEQQEASLLDEISLSPKQPPNPKPYRDMAADVLCLNSWGAEPVLPCSPSMCMEEEKLSGLDFAMVVHQSAHEYTLVEVEVTSNDRVLTEVIKFLDTSER